MSVLGDYIRHIEGLQDALTKRNARIAELEKLLDVFLEIGERRAEERIIKLLESQIHGCSGYDCDSCDDSSQIVDLIALIKGEK